MIGVVGKQVVVHLNSYASVRTQELTTKEERLDVAHELIAAARLLLRDDFATTESLVEALQDMAEEE